MMRIQSLFSNDSYVSVISLIALSACAFTYPETNARPAIVYMSAIEQPPVVSTSGNADLILDPKIKNWMKFQSLAAAWKEQRGVRSSTTDIVALIPYQKIIGMGEAAIPLILSTLRTEGDDPDMWFPALSLLTDSDPVRQEDRGDFSAMAKSWLEWGERAGYVGYLATA